MCGLRYFGQGFSGYLAILIVTQVRSKVAYYGILKIKLNKTKVINIKLYKVTIPQLTLNITEYLSCDSRRPTYLYTGEIR